MEKDSKKESETTLLEELMSNKEMTMTPEVFTRRMGGSIKEVLGVLVNIADTEGIKGPGETANDGEK